MSKKMEKDGMHHVFDTVALPHCSASQSEVLRPAALASLERVSYANYLAPSEAH